MRGIAGFTLIEMMSSLAVVLILTTAIAPSLDNLLARSRSTTWVNWIIGAVNFTRHTAIVYSTPTTLCARKNETDCGGAWHKGLVVFTDRNLNAKIDASDKVINTLAAPGHAGTLKWRAFQNRPYLQMTPMGYTNFQNGNFTYCPPDGNLKFARQIVINIQGRARTIHKRDAEGNRVDRKGKPLKC